MVKVKIFETTRKLILEKRIYGSMQRSKGIVFIKKIIQHIMAYIKFRNSYYDISQASYRSQG